MNYDAPHIVWSFDFAHWSPPLIFRQLFWQLLSLVHIWNIYTLPQPFNQPGLLHPSEFASSISHTLIWGHRVWVSVTDISQSLYKTHLDALQHCDEWCQCGGGRPLEIKVISECTMGGSSSQSSYLTLIKNSEKPMCCSLEDGDTFLPSKDWYDKTSIFQGPSC